MASQIFGTPIAAVSLTDEDRQWFKPRVGPVCGENQDYRSKFRSMPRRLILKKSASWSGWLMRGMIGTAQELGLRVVAEGVETQLAYDFLKGAGCHEAQGYLISRPVPPDAFITGLHTNDFLAQPSAAA